MFTVTNYAKNDRYIGILLQDIRCLTNKYSSYDTFLKPHAVIFAQNMYMLFVFMSTLYSTPLGYWLVKNLYFKSLLHLSDTLQQQIFSQSPFRVTYRREIENIIKTCVEIKIYPMQISDLLLQISCMCCLCRKPAFSQSHTHGLLLGALWVCCWDTGVCLWAICDECRIIFHMWC